jgi:general secretion pathway protein D
LSWPSAAAVRGNVTPQLGNSQRSLPPGYSVQIVPLRYIGVREMMRIIEPFVRCDGGAPDDLGNLLSSGTERSAAKPSTVRRRLDRRHVGGPVRCRTRMKAVMQDSTGGRRSRDEPADRILRVIPIRRMTRPGDHAAARTSTRRRNGFPPRSAGVGEGPRFYVFNLQNQRAENWRRCCAGFTGRARKPRRVPRRPEPRPDDRVATDFQPQPTSRRRRL